MSEHRKVSAVGPSTHRTAILIAAMGCVTAAAVGHWHANAGPLDPPPTAFDAPGVPGETAPSLADLEFKIDALGAQGTPDPGPWEIFGFPATGGFPSTGQQISSLAIDGPVYVRSVTAYETEVVLFDGPGEINAFAFPVTTNWRARNSAVAFGPGAGEGYTQTVTVPVEQVFTNSVHMSWQATPSSQGFFYILYRPIEERP